MAFNPFDIFRRNQRIIFAVVTVFVMFTFVLSSGMGGGGDFFEWLPQWVGSKAQRGDVLCEIDGKRVHTREIADLRHQRVIANQYMAYAAGQTIANLDRDIDAKLSKIPKDDQEKFFEFQRTLRAVMSQPISSLEEVQGAREFLARQQGQLQALTANKSTPAVTSQVARELELLGSYVLLRLGVPREMYFINVPNRNDRDAVEFLLWRKKADDLGIRFSDKDVQNLVGVEFAGYLGVSEMDARRAVVDQRQISDGRLWTALNDEFRVRLAQATVLGTEMPRPTGPVAPAPVYSTPYDLYSFYKEKFSPTAYEMLSVPVENFVSQVTATPSPADLEKLFKEYQNVEPSPLRDTPGFKEPRKAKLEWVSATGKEPYYQTAAAEWLQKAELHAKLGGLMSLPVPSVGPVWAANALVLLEPNLGLEAQYSAIRNQFVSERDQQYITGAFSYAMLDSSLIRPSNLVSAVGGAAGSLLTQAPLGWVAGQLLDQAARDQERRARIRVGLPLVLGSVPGPGLLGTQLSAVAQARAALPQPLPADVYRPELSGKMKDLLAHRFMVQDLEAMQKEIKRLTADVRDPAKKKAAVASYLEGFVSARGLKLGETTELRDEFAIGEESPLAPLKAIADKMNAGNPNARFGPEFFYTFVRDNLDDPAILQQVMQQPPQRQQQFMMQGVVPDTGLYKPRFLPTRPGETPSLDGDPVFLLWRTQESEPRTVTFRVAEPKVLAAWKKLKARDLAKAEAERIAAEIRGKNATNAIVLEQNMKDAAEALRRRWPDPAAQDRVKRFLLSEVAEFEVENSFQNPMQSQVQRFQVMPSANIPFPSAEMTKQLVDERTKPVNTTFVTTDMPKDHFYVTALASHTELPPTDFRMRVYNAPQGSPLRDAVIRGQRMEALEKQQQATLALLKVEFKYENENAELLAKNSE